METQPVTRQPVKQDATVLTKTYSKKQVVFHNKMAHVSQFFRDLLSGACGDVEQKTLAATLFGLYSEWCYHNQVMPVTKITFGKWMAVHCDLARRGNPRKYDLSKMVIDEEQGVKLS